MNLTSKICMALAGIFSIFAFGLGAVTYAADQTDLNANAVCKGTEIVGGSCNGSAADSKVSSLLTDIINIMSWIVGVTSMIVMILGGLWFVTANGSSERVSKARNTVLYALIGLVVVAVSQILVRFVINEVG